MIHVRTVSSRTEKNKWTAKVEQLHDPPTHDGVGVKEEPHGSDACAEHAYVYTDEGRKMCSTCGLMCLTALDASPEWKTGADGRKQSSSRGYTNPFIEDGPIYIGADTGRKVRPYAGWVAPHRCKKRMMKYSEFQYLLACAQRAGITRKIVDDALRIYATVWNAGAKGARGFTKEGIVGAALHLACRASGAPRTIKEIALCFDIPQPCVTQGCSIAMTILSQLNEESDQMDYVATPASFIARYCSALNIAEKYTLVCSFVADRVHRHGIMTENTPNSIAAGVIYFIVRSAHLDVALSDVQRISDISEVTIHKCCTKLTAIRTQVLPSAVIADFDRTHTTAPSRPRKRSKAT